jgi:hypothetical protein
MIDLLDLVSASSFLSSLLDIGFQRITPEPAPTLTGFWLRIAITDACLSDLSETEKRNESFFCLNRYFFSVEKTRVREV